jgi:DNA integrity scanning protein DisA with diadenylate cyclase activity
MIRVLEVNREFESLVGGQEAGGNLEPSSVRPEVLSRVVEIAIDLGSEGREGKAVGTLFVVGDEDTVLPLTNQRILNPFRGYPEEERNVLSVNLEETIKELATVDGAFVIKGDGTVVSSGTYLKTSALPDEADAPRGMGARHQAAAGITFATNCMAVAVSESTGTVTIFRKGQIVTEIDKPHKARQQKARQG